MPAPEEARALLAVARRDFEALEILGDRGADEIFGFHAQQAVEKALKAWLASLGAEYPKSHHLHVLLRLLEDRGRDVARFRDLAELTDYAVQFRYTVFEETEPPLDRPATCSTVEALLHHVGDVVERHTTS